MKFEEFKSLCKLALDYNTFAKFEKAVPADSKYPIFSDKQFRKILKVIFSLAKGTMVENRLSQSMNRVDLSFLLGMPKRTIENREMVVGMVKPYDKLMIDYIYFNNELYDNIMFD